MNTSISQSPVKVAVTGAAGQISYSLLFRIASGGFLPNRKIELRLLEIPQAMAALEGVVMELRDCAFPNIRAIDAFSDPNLAFEDIDYAFLVGARPRGPGMERNDLLQANAEIFSAQGKALNNSAKPSVRVLVIGNPANTNALIAQSNAKNIPSEQFAAMTRLDHNRAVSLLAEKTGATTSDIEKVTVWGNHSPTQYPDLYQASVAGTSAMSLIDRQWYQDSFIPQVQQRGAVIIKARGASSAASAGSAAVDHMRDLVFGNAWTSMAVRPVTPLYDISNDLFYSYPIATSAGNWCIHSELTVNDFSRERMRITERELLEERDAIRHLLA